MIGKTIFTNLFFEYYDNDMRKYLLHKVKTENISYKNLLYIYNNLYNIHSSFVQKNLYPVCEFLCKGYSVEECEKLAGILEKPKELNVFQYDEKAKDKIYYKGFYDLMFAYDSYDKYIKNGNDKETAFKKVNHQLEITDGKQRMIEMQVLRKEHLWYSDKEDYSRYISSQLGILKEDAIYEKTDNAKSCNLMQRYNRMLETRKKYNQYIKETKTKDNLEK